MFFIFFYSSLFLTVPKKRSKANPFLTFMSVRCFPLTLAHEMGHTLGCAHDNYKKERGGFELNTDYTYGYGWHFKAMDGTGFRTIMTGRFPGGPSHAKFPYFSNPDITLFGSKIGDEETANCARVIEENRFAMADNGNETGTCKSKQCVAPIILAVATCHLDDYDRFGPQQALTPISTTDSGFWQSNETEREPYISFQLDKEYEIQEVELVDRVDCCEKRFEEVEVSAYSTITNRIKCGGTQSWRDQTASNPPTYVYKCPKSLRGSVVVVGKYRKNNNSIFHLNQIVVYVKC